MRRAAKKDRNHNEIADAFKRLGFSVADTSRLGGDFPDIVIAKAGSTALVEIKDGKKSASQRKLRPGQQEFKDTWKGEYYVVESLDEVECISFNWSR